MHLPRRNQASAELSPGDSAPWFTQRCTSNERFSFDTIAGRYVVMCFYGSADDPLGSSALQAVHANRQLFDDRRACFFGISLDREDETKARVAEELPGIRFFWDFDARVSKLYGALPEAAVAGRWPTVLVQFWIVLDPSLRVMAIFPFDDVLHTEVFDYLDTLPAPDRHAGPEIVAPVLVLPNVFEPELCQLLINLIDLDETDPSRVARNGGRQTTLVDDGFARRREYTIDDTEVIRRVVVRVAEHVNPEIRKAYCFEATHIERYLVTCYAAEDRAFFRSHRDNTTPSTAHRQFAISVNLNVDFDGGELVFPEYGPRTFKAPAGGAVVFSCTLMHAVKPVTRGRRYAFLPFVFDEDAERLRLKNFGAEQSDAARRKPWPGVNFGLP